MTTTASDKELGFTDSSTPKFESPESVRARLGEVQYLADDAISSVAYLADRLRKPNLTRRGGPALQLRFVLWYAEQVGAPPLAREPLP